MVCLYVLVLIFLVGFACKMEENGHITKQNAGLVILSILLWPIAIILLPIACGLYYAVILIHEIGTICADKLFPKK
jgi:heme/copper-type cytochrome/quinol oxidase subunit 2